MPTVCVCVFFSSLRRAAVCHELRSAYRYVYECYVYINFCVLTSILNSISQFCHGSSTRYNVLLHISAQFHGFLLHISAQFGTLCAEIYRQYKFVDWKWQTAIQCWNCLNRAACAKLCRIIAIDRVGAFGWKPALRGQELCVCVCQMNPNFESIVLIRCDLLMLVKCFSVRFEVETERCVSYS